MEATTSTFESEDYTAIIDLDGVCFNPVERLQKCLTQPWETVLHIWNKAMSCFTPAEADKINWECAQNNDLVSKDPIIPGAPQRVRLISKFYNIRYLTGRSEVCRRGTVESLVGNEFPLPQDGLIMRKEEDLRPDVEVKLEAFDMLKEQGHLLAFVVDDDWSGKLHSLCIEELSLPHYYSLRDYFQFGAFPEIRRKHQILLKLEEDEIERDRVLDGIIKKQEEAQRQRLA